MRREVNMINMYLHPLMELNKDNIQQEIILKRKSIKLLTYNIFLRPPPVKNNENDWKDERLADFIKILDNFDVICLQEMFGSFCNRKQELIKYANKSGLFFYCEPPTPSFLSKYLVDTGLIILSRFPIVEKEFLPYAYNILSDSLGQKGVLYVKIKIRDTYLCLFSTHMQASYFDCTDNQWNLAIQTRTDHTDELISFVRKVINKNFLSEGEGMIHTHKFLVVGDFNIDAHDYMEIRKKIKIPIYNKTEYEIFYEKLEQFGLVKDLMKNKYSKHPFTYGYNGENLPQYDSALTSKEDVGTNQTLDYMFEIIPNIDAPLFKKYENIIDNQREKQNESLRVNLLGKQEESENQNFNNNLCHLSIDYESANVEEFLITNKPYQQLSDHFGLSVELNITQYGNV